MHVIPSELLNLGEHTVGRVAAGVMSGVSAAHCQLLACRFYEALKAQLAQTPLGAARLRGALAAASDQCRRAASAELEPAAILAELRAAVAILDRTRGPRPRIRLRPQLRAIEGGRAEPPA